MLVALPDPVRKRLERLRSELNRAAVSSGVGARVVLYVKTLPGEDAEPHFNRLRAKVAGRGWRIHSTIHDNSGQVAPTESEAWDELMKALAGGFAQGVLTPTYQHISMDTGYYTDALYRISECRCFTSLLVPEPAT
ncbi:MULTISPECIES: hypothetical protein [unclassified Streptomyces]|uniref:hypothetical protein n=1 Tax=unclassified Streptomyces TaxID=2593676 RepID=UPI0033B5D518